MTLLLLTMMTIMLLLLLLVDITITTRCLDSDIDSGIAS
jgi:hypothetical protein